MKPKAKALKTAGGTSGAGGDTSKTRTATSTVANPHTKTSTEAYTQGNFTATVTGGAGKGATTTVHIGGWMPIEPTTKTGTSKVGTAKGSALSKAKK